MKAKSAYSQKLLDPRWQRKRLEAMQQADFKCETCECADKTLHVHHMEYKKGAEPWEYSFDELAVLCVDCHEQLHEAQKLFDAACALAKKKFSTCYGHLDTLTGEILGSISINHSPVSILRPSLSVIEGIANAYCLRPDEVQAAIGKDGRLDTKDL